MNCTEPRDLLAAAVRDACVQDVRAFKPGNVSIAAPGHRMEAAAFIASAHAVAMPLTLAGASVGQRILRAVEASWAAAGCNTNLGIVLLAAPLLCAREKLNASPVSPEDLRTALHVELQGLTLADADDAYRAIRIAQPAGLGAVAAHDVAEPPTITLRAAMQAAAAHDQIARAYTDDYRLVFEIGLPVLQAARQAGLAELWALTRCFLALAAAVPDTHVQRKHGPMAAAEVQQRCSVLLTQWDAQASRFDVHATAAIWPALRAQDQAWKAAGINPGTSADLTVACALVTRLSGTEGYTMARHESCPPVICGSAG